MAAGRRTPLDRRFLPRQWIMLQEATPPGPGRHRRRFLNVSTGQCVQTELPELDGHLLAGTTTEGLLALVDESTHVVRLLNPITRQVAELPSLDTPMTAEIARSVSKNCGFDYQYTVSGIGLVGDDSMVALCLRSLLLVAKPGDDCWKVYNRAHFHSAMSFAGRFYCVTGGAVMALGVTAVANEPPRLEAVADVTFRVCGMYMDTVHLLESDGPEAAACCSAAGERGPRTRTTTGLDEEVPGLPGRSRRAQDCARPWPRRSRRVRRQGTSTARFHRRVPVDTLEHRLRALQGSCRVQSP